MSPKDHTIAAVDLLAETLTALARINPDNAAQSAFNAYGVVDRLNAATAHMRAAAGQYERACEPASPLVVDSNGRTAHARR